jgi:hypothetical protein
MQKLLGLSSQRASRAIVENEREVLLFMHAFLKQSGAGIAADDYAELVPALQAEVQSRFHPYLRVRAIDAHTADESDYATTTHVKIVVESTFHGEQ